MTLDEKAGMMLISTTRMAGILRSNKASRKDLLNGFNEEDLVQNINMFSRKPLPYPLLSASGTTKG
jgi:beta-glucosidase